jgi:hypothetical protein
MDNKYIEEDWERAIYMDRGWKIEQEKRKKEEYWEWMESQKIKLPAIIEIDNILKIKKNEIKHI